MNPDDYPREVTNPTTQPDQPLQYPATALVAPNQAQPSQAPIERPIEQQPPVVQLPIQPNVATQAPTSNKQLSKWAIAFAIVVILSLLIAGAITVGLVLYA